jgi:elongation factor Ts
LEISAELVRALRDKTDAGIMDCKKALKETSGDLEEAVAYLRQKGITVAAKRAGRAASEGSVWAHLSPDAHVGVLLEVNCETDFVAKTPAFVELGFRLAEHVAATDPTDVDTLMSQDCRHQPGLPVCEYVNEILAKTGENVQVRRFTRYASDGLIAAYIHHGGRIGVLLELTGAPNTPEAQEAAKNLAMQVAASSPQAVSRDDVNPELVARESAILKAQALESGKPEKIIERMVAGRLEKFYQEICLAEQPFVKNPDLTVAQYLKEVEKQAGASKIMVRRFTRYQVGA